MLNLIATIASLVLVIKAESDVQKIVGGALLSAALNASIQSAKET